MKVFWISLILMSFAGIAFAGENCEKLDGNKMTAKTSYSKPTKSGNSGNGSGRE